MTFAHEAPLHNNNNTLLPFVINCQNPSQSHTPGKERHPQQSIDFPNTLPWKICLSTLRT